MPVPNPDHLLEQAEGLVNRGGAGAPRQADLRRAISTAYYALFHMLAAAVADNLIGKTNRDSPRYALAYRSIDHRTLRAICEEVGKTTLSARFKKYEPPIGFGKHLPAVAGAIVELQEKRHTADYDPLYKASTTDAKLAVRTARSAIRRFAKASASRRKAFLALLAFSPR